MMNIILIIGGLLTGLILTKVDIKRREKKVILEDKKDIYNAKYSECTYEELKDMVKEILMKHTYYIEDYNEGMEFFHNPNTLPSHNIYLNELKKYYLLRIKEYERTLKLNTLGI
jgi:hypothetical protein